jgi:hypothetical protein
VFGHCIQRYCNLEGMVPDTINGVLVAHVSGDCTNLRTWKLTNWARRSGTPYPAAFNLYPAFHETWQIVH